MDHGVLRNQKPGRRETQGRGWTEAGFRGEFSDSRRQLSWHCSLRPQEVLGGL